MGNNEKIAFLDVYWTSIVEWLHDMRGLFFLCCYVPVCRCFSNIEYYNIMEQ